LVLTQRLCCAQQDDEDDGDDVAALLARPARACKSASDSCLAVATGASGRPGGSSDESDQEALPAPVAAAPPPSMQVRAVAQPFHSMQGKDVVWYIPGGIYKFWHRLDAEASSRQ
jgi:hypothetical protein